MNGPEMSADRAAVNSATAARCAADIFSAGIGGMRSCAPAGGVAVKTTATHIEIVTTMIVALIGPPSVPHIVAYTALFTMANTRRPGRPLRVALLGVGY